MIKLKDYPPVTFEQIKKRVAQKINVDDIPEEYQEVLERYITASIYCGSIYDVDIYEKMFSYVIDSINLDTTDDTTNIDPQDLYEDMIHRYHINMKEHLNLNSDFYKEAYETLNAKNNAIRKHYLQAVRCVIRDISESIELKMFSENIPLRKFVHVDIDPEMFRSYGFQTFETFLMIHNMLIEQMNISGNIQHYFFNQNMTVHVLDIKKSGISGFIVSARLIADVNE